MPAAAAVTNNLRLEIISSHPWNDRKVRSIRYARAPPLAHTPRAAIL